MALLISLIVLLLLAIVFFITYPILKGKIVREKYDVFCSKKIRKISIKNHYKFLTNLNMYSYENERIEIDHIIFAKKYIYILTNFYFEGDVFGDEHNNSWILSKFHNQGNEYIDNISTVLSKKNRVFSAKINSNPDLIIPIAIVNNECAIKVNGINTSSTFIVHYSSLKKLIKKLESRSIADLEFEQVENQYEILRNENQ